MGWFPLGVAVDEQAIALISIESELDLLAQALGSDGPLSNIRVFDFDDDVGAVGSQEPLQNWDQHIAIGRSVRHQGEPRGFH